MPDLATLGVEYDGQGLARAKKDMADTAKSAKRTQNAVDDLSNAFDVNTGARNRNRRQSEADDAVAERLYRRSNFRLVNLGYQLNDVAVGLTSGQAAGVVAVQQGSQIVQLYAGQGGVNAALRDFGAILRGVMLGPVGLAVGALGFLSLGVNALKKDFHDAGAVGVTFGDTLGATMQTLGSVFIDTVSNAIEPFRDEVVGAFSAVEDAAGESIPFLLRALALLGRRLEAVADLATISLREVARSLSDAVPDWARTDSPGMFRNPLALLPQRSEEGFVERFEESFKRLNDEYAADIEAILARDFGAEIRDRAIVNRDRRLAEDNAKKRAQAERERIKALEQAMDQLAQKEDSLLMARLRAEGRVIGAITLRLETELRGLQDIADRAIKNGADAVEINRRVAQARADAERAADLEIAAHNRRLADARLADQIRLGELGGSNVILLERERRIRAREDELRGLGVAGDLRAQAEGFIRAEDEAAMRGRFTSIFSESLTEAIRTGDWASVFGNALQNAVSNALSRALESIGGILFDLFRGRRGGPFNGGFGGGFGSFLGSIFGGFRADGGPVQAGRAYVVGERGPELMVPNRSGFVVPAHQTAGTQTVRVVVTANDERFNAYVDRRATPIAARAAQAAASSVIPQVNAGMRRGAIGNYAFEG